MLNFYILAKHLTTAAETNQPLDRHIALIIEAVKAQEFDVVEEQVDILPDQV